MPSPSTLRRFISLQDAAAMLSVSTKTCARRVADGTLPGYHVAGTRAVRVELAQVEDMLQPVAESTSDGALLEHVRRVVDAAPELTPEQRDQLATILRRANATPANGDPV